MIVASSNPRVAGHLALACAEHLRWCRRNGVSAPVEMVELLSVLQADSGQGRPSVAFEEAVPDRVLMSYEQAAAALGVSVRTVRRMTRDGRLPVVLIGSRRLIPASAVDEYGRGVAS